MQSFHSQQNHWTILKCWVKKYPKFCHSIRWAYIRWEYIHVSLKTSGTILDQIWRIITRRDAFVPWDIAAMGKRNAKRPCYYWVTLGPHSPLFLPAGTRSWYCVQLQGHHMKKILRAFFAALYHYHSCKIVPWSFLVLFVWRSSIWSPWSPWHSCLFFRRVLRMEGDKYSGQAWPKTHCNVQEPTSFMHTVPWLNIQMFSEKLFPGVLFRTKYLFTGWPSAKDCPLAGGGKFLPWKNWQGCVLHPPPTHNSRCTLNQPPFIQLTYTISQGYDLSAQMTLEVKSQI